MGARQDLGAPFFDMVKSKSTVKEDRVPPRRRTQTAEQSEDKKRGRATKERIQKLLTEIEDRLEADSSKASVADYIRLLQLERELDAEDEAPKELRVTWVDPGKSASGT